MAGRAITVSEALGWANILKSRIAELTALRNTNSAERIQRYGGQPDITTKPTYDAKKLDSRITLLQREQRLLDAALKRSNASTVLKEYTQDDAVLGELE